MKEDREKDQPAQRIVDHESGADGDAVEERVHAESAQHRIAGARGDEFVVVRLFAVVEMGVDGVLEQVHRRSSRP